MSWSGGDVIWSSESNLTKKWLHEERETSSPLNIYSFIKYGVHIDSDLKVIVAYLNDQKVVTHDHFIHLFIFYVLFPAVPTHLRHNHFSYRSHKIIYTYCGQRSGVAVYIIFNLYLSATYFSTVVPRTTN